MVKTCSCGRTHDHDGWLSLKLVGYVGKASGRVWCSVELRNCTCGSTLGVVTLRHPDRVLGDDDTWEDGR